MSTPTIAQAVADRMSAEAAAQYLGLAKQTLARYRSEGRGPRYSRIGTRITYSRTDLDAYLAAAVVETADSRKAA